MTKIFHLTDTSCKKSSYAPTYPSARVVACRSLESENDELLSDMLQHTRQCFTTALTKIQEVLSLHSISEVFDLMEFLNQNQQTHDEFKSLPISFLHCSLLPLCGSVRLYDGDCQPLFAKTHLLRVFKEWKPKDKTVWLVFITPSGS